MKSKDLQPRLLYPARLSIKMEVEKRSFPDQKKVSKSTSSPNQHCKRYYTDCFEKMKREEEEREEYRHKGKKWK